LVGALITGLLIGCAEPEESKAPTAPAAVQKTPEPEAAKGEQNQVGTEATAKATKEEEMMRLRKATELALKERPALTGATVSAAGDTRAKQPLEPGAVWKPEGLNATQATQRIPQTGTAEQIAEIETKFGKIYLEFLPDVAPKTVANFKKLASSGFYDGTTFHRVIPRFVIQGGDPNSKDDDRANDGQGGPGWAIPAEFNNTEHARGVVSMARSNEPDSAGSQFFICLERLPHLDQKYTAFAKVIRGMDVVDKIAAVSRDRQDNPIDKIEMRVRLINREPVGPSGD
jgi:peptidyl-prolyl cis-trans isomerase B (cyclophilin B)